MKRSGRLCPAAAPRVHDLGPPARTRPPNRRPVGDCRGRRPRRRRRSPRRTRRRRRTPLVARPTRCRRPSRPCARVVERSRRQGRSTRTGVVRTEDADDAVEADCPIVGNARLVGCTVPSGLRTSAPTAPRADVDVERRVQRVECAGPHERILVQEEDVRRRRRPIPWFAAFAKPVFVPLRTRCDLLEALLDRGIDAAIGRRVVDHDDLPRVLLADRPRGSRARPGPRCSSR